MTPENEAAAQAIVDAHYAELSRRINAKVDDGTMGADVHPRRYRGARSFEEG